MHTDAGRASTARAAKILFSLLFGMSILMLLACALAYAMRPSLVRALAPSPTAQRPPSWSVVEIPKPTQTPSPAPTPMPAAQPAEQVEASPTEGAPLITMEIVEDAPASTIAQQVPRPEQSGEKYILVSISEQHLYAYENGQLAYSFVASTGMGNSTRIGRFNVLDKIPNAYGANWNIWMPEWLGIYWSGSLENGIHALPILPGGARLWAGYLGTPISFGCVVLGVDDARQLYNWVDIGTPVEIQW